MVFSNSMYLIFVFLFGLSYGVYTGNTHSACYDTCPAGYYKTGKCAERGNPHRCEVCKANTFTDIPNNTTKCETCSRCRDREVEIKKCIPNSDRKCGCPEGHYFFGNPAAHDCQPCPAQKCEKTSDYRDCRRKCKSHTLTTSTQEEPFTTTTRPSTPLTPTSNKSSNTPSKILLPSQPAHQMHWFYLVAVVIVTLLVLSWLLLLNRNPLRYLACCPCWGTNKDLELPVEDLRTDEQQSHQSCNQTTVTFSITEQTPMMLLSPATEDPPTPGHVSPKWEASRQDEQSERLPAVVLYAIIKEVPLRRWKEFLRLLLVADQQLERVELEAGLGMGSIEKQYQMLRLWSQRPSASLGDVFSALQYMDLSGCAQLLQESLENLQHRT